MRLRNYSGLIFHIYWAALIVKLDSASAWPLIIVAVFFAIVMIFGDKVDDR